MWRKPLAFAFGMVLPAFAAAALSIDDPALSSAQSKAQRIGTLAREQVAQLMSNPAGRSAPPAKPAADRGPASITQSAPPAALSRSEPASPRLSVGPITGAIGSPLHIDVKLENAERLSSDSMLMVSNVPEYAALLPGKPIGAGAWVVPASKAAELGIITYARPASRQRLMFDLVSRDGVLISSTQAALNVAAPEPPGRSAAVRAAPATIRSAAIDPGTLHSRHR
jgi:hypothetical protein